jgi:LCP family protein required for cell wall assembly
MPRRLLPVVIVFGLIFLLLAGIASYSYFTFAGPLSQIVGQDASCAKNGNSVHTGRINILLLGSDNDEKFQGQPLAQTDIVVTIDPAAKTVGMLSIPRDFFLNVPGYGMHKLDEAYSLGGVTLSCLTIEQDFGIPLNYYAWVGLDGFINVINTMGGVDVDVTHAIVDDNYPNDINNKSDPYALQRLYIAPGPQHLDGQQALEYVRSRHADLVGDFGRSARQQQVLLALKNKLNNSSIFSKLPTIANELKGSVKTDMQLSDVLQVMNFARGLNTNNIQRLVLGPPYSTAGTAPGDSGTDAGVSVVLPNCSKIITALQQLFGQSIQPVCNIQGNPGVSLRIHSPDTTTMDQQDQASLLSGGKNGAFRPHAEANNTIASIDSSPTDLFGWRSLLDLQILGASESPGAFQE